MKRITISFYDSVTGDDLGGITGPYRKLDMIRCKWSRHVKLHKQIMTNTYRRLGLLIGDIKFKLKVE